MKMGRWTYLDDAGVDARVMADARAEWQAQWDADGKDFPEHGLPEDQLRYLLRYAILAPSTRNTQPWRFRVTSQRVRVYADLSRGQLVVDPYSRELVISCGCAVGFLCAAARPFGFNSTVRLLPDPADPTLLADVMLSPGEPPSEAERELAAAMLVRHTHREPFADVAVPEHLVERLRGIAEAHSVWLAAISEPGPMSMLADLVAQAYRRQMADPAFRAEYESAVLEPGSSLREGIPAAALGLDETTVEEHIGVPAPNPETDHHLVREYVAKSPLLLVLGTNDDDTAAWLRTGIAHALVSLRATCAGVSTSYLNQPLELADLRASIGALVDQEGYPQLVTRHGYGSHTTVTPRRSVEDVLA
jgi:nitroreductase